MDRSAKPTGWGPKPETRNPKPWSRWDKPTGEPQTEKPWGEGIVELGAGADPPTPETRNPKPETQNPEPGTRTQHFRESGRMCRASTLGPQT